MPKVTFVTEKKEVEIPQGANLREEAQKAGIEHYYVEFDRSTDPMQVTRDSYNYLQKVM